MLTWRDALLLQRFPLNDVSTPSLSLFISLFPFLSLSPSLSISLSLSNSLSLDLLIISVDDFAFLSGDRSEAFHGIVRRLGDGVLGGREKPFVGLLEILFQF
jgi:hypothetical protein